MVAPPPCPAPSASPRLSRKTLSVLLAALAAVPLSGCLSDPGGSLPLIRASGLFSWEPRTPGEPGAEPVASCAELDGLLRQRALDQARVLLDRSLQEQAYYHSVRAVDFAMEDAGAPQGLAATAASDGAHSAAGAQVTGTNNQEAAADEGDLVKTDGEWTYVLSGGVLHVLRSRTVGGLEKVGELALSPAGYGHGGQLLLEPRSSDPRDDRLVAVLGGQPVDDQPFLSDSVRQRAGWGMTRVAVVSLADRSAPSVEHETWIEGQPQGVRLVDGTAYVVVERSEPPLPLRTWASPEEQDLRRMGLSYQDYDRMDETTRTYVRQAIARQADEDNQRILEGLDLQDELPVVLTQRFGLLVPEAVTEESCRGILALPDATGRAFTTVLALGVADRSLPSTTTQVLGGSATVYADAGALVLAAPTLDGWWSWAQPGIAETTDLLWFDLDGLRVTQRAAGRVPGSLLDSFALDVHDGTLRVATTTGLWGGWLGAATALASAVVVLDDVDGVLVPRGQVGGIAPGERLWSVRFTDERAYLVTFRQMDPLWVVDLASAVPRILGELHVPGVSTYIHPLGDEQLLTIGYGGGPDGLGLDPGQIVVSLFGVSDPKKPTLLDTLDLSPPGGWSSSGALHEHHAFTYWAAIGTLAVPLTTVSEGYYTPHGEWVSEQHVALKLVTVDRDAGKVSLRGEVDHDALAGRQGWGVGIERSWFLGFPPRGPVSVYAMSPFGVTSNDLATLERQASVGFAQPEAYGGCCWD